MKLRDLECSYKSADSADSKIDKVFATLLVGGGNLLLLVLLIELVRSDVNFL